MNFTLPQKYRGAIRIFTFAVCVVLGSYQLRAGDTSDGKAAASTTEEEPEYKNWIDLGIGGLIIDGDAAQFKQQHRMSGDVYGGIEDMHWEHTFDKDGTFSVDGRAIFDNDDYNVKLELNKPGLGYIKAGYTEFRSWYDDNGGFFPPNGGTFIEPRFQELSVDRGEAWVELGLRVPDWPEITLHYSHLFREGQKDSTIWGDTNLTGIAVNPARKIAPAFRDIDETRDIFSLEAVKTFGNTDVDLGMRYEHDNIDDRLQLERGAGQVPPAVSPPGAQRFITQNEKSEPDLFSGHALTETHLSDTLWFTAGYSYTTMGTDISGTRIIGTDYNSMFISPLPVAQNFDAGFLNLAGTSQVDDHVFNANLMWMPLKDLTVLTAFRYTHENQNTDATFISTTVPGAGLPAALEPFSAETSQELDNFAESLELRYTGIENWVFYFEGEWEQESGDISQHEVEGGEDQGRLREDTNLNGQKYTAGVNWYPAARLAISGQSYYKRADYDNDFHSDLNSPPFGADTNQRLLGQTWDVYDANIRITWRPKVPQSLGSVSFVTRYDFMQTAISGQWAISPAGLGDPPTGTIFDEIGTGLTTSHIISETMTWNPCARFYFQASGSYVLDQTNTPANSIDLSPNASPTIVNFRNDYWTATGDAGYIFDDKTDLHAEYTFYRANDYFNNSQVALPYGMGATEHTVSASISRQLTKQMRLVLRYAYFDYSDELSGGHNNYRAHSIYSGLQFRF
jgi:hypothetical protein